MKASYSAIVLLLLAACFFACQPKEENPTDTDTSSPKTDTVTTVKADSNATVKTSAPTYGIDLSKYQGDEVELLNKGEDKIAFIICKSTEGETYVDPDFKKNWETIEQKGFIRGTYHFYHTADSPEAQAAHFLATVSDLQATDFPLIVDFEEGGIEKSQSVESIQKALLVFLKEIETKTNRKPIIYTDINVGDHYLNKAEFAAYPLWIANYIKGDKPDLPTAWKDSKWQLWQRSGDYKIEQFTDDFDVFNGNLAELKAFIAGN